MATCESAFHFFRTATNVLQGDASMLCQHEIFRTNMAETNAQKHIHLFCNKLALSLRQHAQDHDRSSALSTRDGKRTRIHVPKLFNDGALHETLCMHEAKKLLKTREFSKSRTERALDHIAAYKGDVLRAT